MIAPSPTGHIATMVKVCVDGVNAGVVPAIRPVASTHPRESSTTRVQTVLPRWVTVIVDRVRVHGPVERRGHQRPGRRRGLRRNGGAGPERYHCRHRGEAPRHDATAESTRPRHCARAGPDSSGDLPRRTTTASSPGATQTICPS